MKMLCLSGKIGMIFLLCSFSRSDLSILRYVDTYSDIAVEEMNRTGIPASITLAQGIIESGFGTSQLSRKSNNHFGIKCNNNWLGEGYYQKDDDYVNGSLVASCFRTYDSPIQSYIDHSEFLKANKRYRFLFDLDKTDYRAWARGLKKAGYATARNYATLLINTIEKYELYQYDHEEGILLAGEVLMVPGVEKIPDQYTFETTSDIGSVSSNTETLVATAPPPSTYIPDTYQAGDGLKTSVGQDVPISFEEAVFGNSSRYLGELSPRTIVDK